MTLFGDLLDKEKEELRDGLEHVQVVDGGYLAWKYGSSIERMYSWPPPWLLGATIMMDSRESNRRDRFPAYKSARISRREIDDYAKRIHRMVAEFQAMIKKDERFNFVEVPGAEADDLVALAAWGYGADEPVRVLGKDKDLLQLGSYFTLLDGSGVEVTLENYYDTLPKTLQKAGSLEAWQIPLILAILGDKSDSIPRLCPPGIPGLTWMRELIWGGNPWSYLRQTPEAAQNFYNVILPDPHMLGLGIEETVELAAAGKWNHKLLPKRVVKWMKKWNLR